MHKMARSTVFISGMSGLGVEIGETSNSYIPSTVSCTSFCSQEHSAGRCQGECYN